MKIKKINGKKPDYADDSYYAEIVNDDGSVVGLLLYGESAPVSYDHERVGRIVERMHEMEECLHDYDGCDETMHYSKYIKKWEDTGRRESLLGYIEHGDKPIETPLEMLKTLREYHRQGATQAVMDNYWKQIDEVIENAKS